MLEKKMKESYEEMLFRYGLSCADNLLVLKKISQEDYDRLFEYADKKEVPDKEFIERIFSAAVKRIGEKTAEAVEKYFLEKHNAVIENREGNYSRLWKISPDRCLECMAGKAVIIGVGHKMGIPVYNVRYKSGKMDIAIGRYLWDEVQIGDTITIHNKSAVRKYES
jgi:hypothetical protein